MEIVDNVTLENGLEVPVMLIDRDEYEAEGFGAYATFAQNERPEIYFDRRVWDAAPQEVRDGIIAHEKAHLDLGHAFISLAATLHIGREQIEYHADAKAALDVGRDTMEYLLRWMGANPTVFGIDTTNFFQMRDLNAFIAERIKSLHQMSEDETRDWIETGREFISQYIIPDVERTINDLIWQQKGEVAYRD